MNILTRSPDGGCVTVAVTRHEPSEESMAAESIVVFGSETLARLAHGHTGAASGKSGFGGVSAARTKVIAARRVVTRIALLISRRRRKTVSFMAELFFRVVARNHFRISRVSPHPIPLPFRRGEGARRAGEGSVLLPERKLFFALSPNACFSIELPDARHFILELQYADRAHHFADGGPGVIGPEDAAIFVFVIAETYFVTVSVLERFSIPQL